MGRKVQLRVSYLNDARFLLRLREAIEKDHRQTVEWKRKAAYHARELSSMLMAIDTGNA